MTDEEINKQKVKHWTTYFIAAFCEAVFVYLVFSVVNGFNSLKWPEEYRGVYVGVTIFFLFFITLAFVTTQPEKKKE